MTSSIYGDNCAAFYDDIYGPAQAVVVRTLCSLARGGSVLELGLATGRTAIALSEKGLTVSGIESSSAMLDQLRRKPGVDKIRIVEGDFASISLPEQFDLIFALVNTFCLLETQRRQSQGLRNDALTQSAGLVLKERLGDWQGSPYRPEVGNHVTVYGRA